MCIFIILYLKFGYVLEDNIAIFANDLQCVHAHVYLFQILLISSITIQILFDSKFEAYHIRFGTYIDNLDHDDIVDGWKFLYNSILLHNWLSHQ